MTTHFYTARLYTVVESAELFLANALRKKVADNEKVATVQHDDILNDFLTHNPYDEDIAYSAKTIETIIKLYKSLGYKVRFKNRVYTIK